MQGLILAGGRGSRLAADGVEAPKALVEVGGRPQIVNLIETFAELGCASVTCMVREGITVLDPPAEYPEYGPQYYAVFFADPDGMKLEVVHEPTLRGRVG